MRQDNLTVSNKPSNIAALINDMLVTDKTQQRKINSRTVLFGKIAARISYLFSSPNFEIPKYNLRKHVLVARHTLGENFTQVDRQTIQTTEISKILMKIDLCFSFNQQVLLQQLIRQVVNEGSKLSKYQFVSLFMPVLHLNNDPIEVKEIAEGGSFHTDRDHHFGYNGSKVLWLPFTDYGYEGIATKKWFFRNFFHIVGPKLGFSMLKKCRSIPVGSRNTHIAGDWMFWTDVFPHGGLRNRTDEDAIALIVRFSSKKTKQTFMPIKKVLSDELTNIDADIWDGLVENCKLTLTDMISNLGNEKINVEILENDLDTFLNTIEQKNQGSNTVSLRNSALRILLYGVETMENRIKSFPMILEEIHLDAGLTDTVIDRYSRLKQQLEKLILGAA